jgi:hypothetical protein
LKLVAKGQEISFRAARSDFRNWLAEPFPVILIVYDAQAEVAYWLYVQAYFARQPGFDPMQGPDLVTVRLSRSNVVDPQAIRRFAGWRDHVLSQIAGKVQHHE